MRRCLSRLRLHGTTANERFGRSKPVVTRTGSRSAQPRAMSRATCGVAVAVSATIARALEVARRVGEAEVVGAEVVAPLRDAVRLVDDEQPDAHARICSTNAGEAKRSGAT